MQKVRLAQKGIEVSRMCFGTLTMGPLQKNLPINEGADLILLAHSLGVNFLDTAELYETYPYVKEALRHENSIVVCTKSYAYDAKTAEESYVKATDGIGRDYIDMFLLHEQESEHTLRGHYEAVEFFLKKKEEGHIGALGLSTHFVAGVDASLLYPELEIVFPLINPSGIGIVDGDEASMKAAMQRAKAANKAILSMKPLGGGHLIANKEEALSYALNLPMVDSIAIGMQSEAEVRYNVAVFNGEKPDEKWAKQLSNTQRKLHIDTWCTACAECVRRCKNNALYIENGMARVATQKCALCGYCAKACKDFCIKVV